MSHYYSKKNQKVLFKVRPLDVLSHIIYTFVAMYTLVRTRKAYLWFFLWMESLQLCAENQSASPVNYSSPKIHYPSLSISGSEKEITAFFTDIENYSVIASSLSTQKLINLLNEYFSVMTEVIEHSKGFLDKYVGDAMVAIFGDNMIPQKDHCLNACIAACKIQKHQRLLREYPTDVGTMRTRIGINTGMAFVGNIGYAKRFNYTMIGDSVNLASRCESSAKRYGVSIVTTEFVVVEVNKVSNTIVFRPIDYVRFGKTGNKVCLYEVVGFKKALTLLAQECLKIFAKGFEAYKNKQWRKAIGFFQNSEKLEVNLPYADRIATNPSKVLLSRCEWFLSKAPQSNWDGVWVIEK